MGHCSEDQKLDNLIEHVAKMTSLTLSMHKLFDIYNDKLERITKTLERINMIIEEAERRERDLGNHDIH